MSEARSFGFNASAVAFGGLIKPPSTARSKSSRSLKGAAAIALAPAGGIGECYTKRYKEDGVSFKNALTIVEGTIENDYIYNTTATVQLEKLDVFGRVKCNAMQAVIRSRREYDDTDSSFSIEATFDGLCIADDKVAPPLDFKLFRQVPTYAEFLNFFSDSAHMKTYAPAFGWVTESGVPDLNMIKAARAAKISPASPIRCSLLTTRIDQNTGFSQDGYTLTVAGLGKIHLAEVLIKPSLRRINMLRFEVTKPGTPGRGRTSLTKRDGPPPDEYNATVCSGEGNGSHSYP